MSKSIQDEFEDAVSREQFESLKLDMTKDIYNKNFYASHNTRIAYNYYLCGYIDSMRAKKGFNGD